MADAQELSMQMQAVQQQLQQLERRGAMLERGTMEIQQAIDTLQGLQNADGDQDVLVPIGGGVQVPARIAPQAQVILDVGAGYAKESDAAAAADDLRQQRDAANQDLAEVNQQIQQLMQHGQRISQQLAQQD